MNGLIVAVENIIHAKDWKGLFFSLTRYVEILAVSSEKETKEMLHYYNKHHFLDCPYWVRLIAFRLLVLQDPGNKELQHWTKQVLGVFQDPLQDKKSENWWTGKKNNDIPQSKPLNRLKQLVNIRGKDWKKLYTTSTKYIEDLSHSSGADIEEMLNYVYEHYLLECPFWARLIAFRMLVLQNPNDEKMKQWAASDIKFFCDPVLEKLIIKSWSL